MNKRVRTTLLVLLLPLMSAMQVRGQDFGTTAEDDTFFSLGILMVAVHINFVPFMNTLGIPAPTTGGNGLDYGPTWDPATQRFTSPLLFDNQTKVGRSAPHLDGASVDASGVAVGTAGTMIADGDAPVRPTGFDVTGRREVHTEIRKFTLSNNAAGSTKMSIGEFGGPTFIVRAGTEHGLPVSAGEVQSKSNSGLAANDFPAQSFFDVFVDVEIAGLESGGSTVPTFVLTNSTPLLVFNASDELDNFPPQVIYVHGQTSAVPLYFKSAVTINGNFIPANTFFGFLTLAGHGAGATGRAGKSKGPDIQQIQPPFTAADFLLFMNNPALAPQMPFNIDQILPVDLVDFTLRSSDSKVIVGWRTASEEDNAGFEIYRSKASSPDFKLIGSYLTNPELTGLGTSSTGQSYSFTDGADGSLQSGIIYRYQIVDVSSDGVRKTHPGKSIRIEGDESTSSFDYFKLYSITPNPASNEISVSFSLADASAVTMEIYTLDGKLLATPVAQQNYVAGGHLETISTEGLVAGSYVVKLTVGLHNLTRQFVIVR